MIRLMTLLISFSIYAKDKIVLGSFNIPEFVTSKDSGVFIDLVKEIGRRTNIEVEIVLRPPKRTITSFATGQVDGYFPALDYFNKGLSTANTAPFYYKKDFFISFQDSSQLRGKKVCLTSGYPYEKSLLENKDLTFLYTHSDQTCIQMLLKKRADIFVCELHSGVSALKNLNVRAIHISPTAISKLDVFFSFQDSKKGQRLAKIFSNEILEMRKEKTLSQFFKSSIKHVNEFVNFGYDPTVK